MYVLEAIDPLVNIQQEDYEKIDPNESQLFPGGGGGAGCHRCIGNLFTSNPYCLDRQLSYFWVNAKIRLLNSKKALV